MEQIRKTKRKLRHKRIRARIKGTAKIPRLCIFCSNKYIYAQLVDDEKGKTILSVDDRKLERKVKGKVLSANEVGQILAKESLEKKIEKVVFDRGGYKYHGRVKSLAEGARQGGLKF
ncbi:MAG: 50S ribosomal protein L18 [Candidatus Portnoybacteria bacterium RBG_13_40_8]|uniref:Large ribosomal subunit protein uL18 n=1 Tax=Candidatus Portnoybacteria bacterium RBG_13_40_8 TaxID=1801990 RepID=A0A1G2F4C3_9BACT|nr:MAG: 50S ribosomal protein L18 [Candidatus Portnoybacteria bacterium RBG_13_40_8]OGZ35573.1 MAG: 50S ribosomal protein L18 [Candidatus Portnoybacteria bacterium RIFCSPHIGHO2_01_FULL_39_19]